MTTCASRAARAEGVLFKTAKPVVTLFERADRHGVAWLRWYEGSDVKRRSLGRRVRDAKGRLLPAELAWAKDEALAQHAQLAGRARPARTGPLTLGELRTLIADPVHGKWPGTPTARMREVCVALEFAAAELGTALPLADLTRPRLQQLWRARIRACRAAGVTGLRAAEVTIGAVLSAATWAREQELVPPGTAAAPERWRDALRADWAAMAAAPVPEPKRPRHTEAELRCILAAAPQVDPRLALALAIGAELRLGQVLRLRRADVGLDALEVGERRVTTVTVRGAGKKRGEQVVLTDGQARALREALTTGYLRELEAEGGDFPLFPSTQLAGGRSGQPRAVVRHRTVAPIGRRAALAWFKAAERLAGVPSLPGRGWYGLRRAGVDAGKARGISREGLQRLGGWTDTQVPDSIYADQEAAAARLEAAQVRAQIRGETGVTDTPKTNRGVIGGAGDAA